MAVDISMPLVELQVVAIDSLKPHPRNYALYGDSDDISELAKSIDFNGKLESPVIVNQQNTIISGHRRWRAAKGLGWSTIPVERRYYTSEIHELEALLIANLYRDKTTTQRGNEYPAWLEVYAVRGAEKQREQADKGIIGGKFGDLGGRPRGEELSVEHNNPLEANLPQGGYSNFPKNPNNSITPDETTATSKSKKPRATQSREKAAQNVGMKARTVEKVVKTNPLIISLRDRGYTTEAQALECENNRSADSAHRLCKLPEEMLLRVLRKLADGEAKTGNAAALAVKREDIEAQVKVSAHKPKITLSPCELWLPEQPLVDLLITDPPYSTDVEDIESFANSWLPLALSRVKPTGRAYVCIGAYPRELQVYLSVAAKLAVAQVLVWSYKNTLGPVPKYDYKLNWQAILYFKGEAVDPLDCPVMIEQFASQTMNAPDGRLGERYHAWQKPDKLAEQLIRHSTKVGDTVMDCFSGTGTFLLAANKLGRIAIGCEKSTEMAALASKRGCEIIYA